MESPVWAAAGPASSVTRTAVNPVNARILWLLCVTNEKANRKLMKSSKLAKNPLVIIVRQLVRASCESLRSASGLATAIAVSAFLVACSTRADEPGHSCYRSRRQSLRCRTRDRRPLVGGPGETVQLSMMLRLSDGFDSRCHERDELADAHAAGSVGSNHPAPYRALQVGDGNIYGFYRAKGP